MKKISVGILGATGVVGQQYIKRLIDHPWFDITYLAASVQSAGKSYGQAVEGRWRLPEALPENIKNCYVHSINQVREASKLCTILFSAIDTQTAKIWEPQFAEAGLIVISNASAYRNDDAVPIIIPEINADHLKLVQRQKELKGWKGGLLVKPNCTVQSYLLPLHAIHQKAPIKRAIVTTMQAVSGAGYPGVASLDCLDNIVPYIAGEEDKCASEPLKIWGTLNADSIEPAKYPIFSVHCNRVPITDGHTSCVSFEFLDEKLDQDEIIELWKTFEGPPQSLQLPSAPKKPLIYRIENDRPQPRLDRDSENGMAVTMGRLRPCPVFDWRFVTLSHNTARGAAGGGVLNAELFIRSSQEEFQEATMNLALSR
ncbi:MAG: aspartate-semialdehyde dehydrogenase [Parachlamydiales bacterium]|nr:aspartate-semialdehyde dehydrogenase [Parachlamydiales bacterium]